MLLEVVDLFNYGLFNEDSNGLFVEMVCDLCGIMSNLNVVIGWVNFMF